jgi:hypothetical protein
VIVVEREVLVEGTPEAEAYQAAADDDSSVPSWLVPAVSAALLGAFALVIVAGRRRRTR